jgi:DNA-binding MarR family transcriptional regulator
LGSSCGASWICFGQKMCAHAQTIQMRAHARKWRYDLRMAEEPEGLGAFAALLQVQAAVVRRLELRLEEHRLVPIAQYDVLLELNAAPGRRLRMQQLADRVVLSRSRVSRVVDEMEKAGLVRREPDPDDKRAAFAVITDDGRAALRKAAPVYLQGIEEEFLSHLGAGERKSLERSLRRVLAAHRGEPNETAAP